MKLHILRATPLAALLALAACDTQPTTIVAGGPTDPDADKMKTAKPVKLPPAILANKSYRCKDNGLIYVDWFNDNQTANLHIKEKASSPIPLTAPSVGAPFVGGDYALTGNATSKSVNLKKGSSAQDCDA